MKEKDRCLSLLEQLKDYDKKLAEELAAKALQEEEKQRLEVKIFFLTLLFGARTLE